MEEKNFFNTIGIISWVSWGGYFLIAQNLYTLEEIMSGMVFISVLVFMHFIFTTLYFTFHHGRKTILWSLLLIGLYLLMKLFIE